MRVIAKVDVLGDAELQQRMVRLSWWILGAGLLAGLVAWASSRLPAWRPGGEGHRPRLVPGAGARVRGGAPVHELVHAAAFLLLGGGDVHVSFGFKDYMLYTSANGATLPRRRFEAVLPRQRSC